MRRDYTTRPGKESTIANRRQTMEHAQHNGANEFVKSEQAKDKRMAARDPKLESRYMEFNGAMMNNGAHAQELAVRLTEGLDKIAFPVRSQVDMTQDG